MKITKEIKEAIQMAVNANYNKAELARKMIRIINDVFCNSTLHV